MTIPEVGGSFISRKFVITILALCLITGVSVLSLWFPTSVALLPTFIGGIIGVTTLYMSGNVANKFVVGKQLAAINNNQQEKE